MWLLAKFAFVLLAVLGRYFRKYISWRKNELRSFAGSVVEVRQKTGRSGEVTETLVQVSVPGASLFKISHENKFDSLFKNVGLSDELQTGDAAFDDLVYIASDDYSFRRGLTENPDLRRMIKSLFNKALIEIQSDGEFITFVFDGNVPLEQGIGESCVVFTRHVRDFHAKWKGLFPDIFRRRIFLTELFVYGLGSYVASSAIPYMLTMEGHHLEMKPVIFQGILLGLAVIVALIGFLFLFLRGSSRGHHVLTESFVVLMVTINLGSVSAIMDLNQGLDNSDPTISEAVIERVYSLQKGSSRHRRTKYYIHFKPTGDWSWALPRRMNIDIMTFEKFKEKGGRKVKIAVSNGALGHPWIRSIELSSDTPK